MEYHMLYVLGTKNFEVYNGKNLNICRVPAKCTRQNKLCRVPAKKHSVKIRVCWVPDDRHLANNNGRQPVWRLAHAAATCANVAECLPCGTRHRYFMPSVGLLPSAGTRQKLNVPCAETLPSAWGSALGKEFVCRVPVVWHSANNKALGIYAFSGSVHPIFFLKY